MSEQELEEQVEGSEVDETQTDDTGETTESPDKTSKNKSNFKKLSDSLKAERAEKAQIAKEKAELEEELHAWRSENPDLVKQSLSKKSDGIDKWDLALFLVTNPDAKDHLDDIKEYMSDMKNPDIEKAWKYVKPTIIQESKTSVDFDIKGKAKAKHDLKTMSMEDAYTPWNLTKEERIKWRELHPDA